ncbi:MAG: DUF805 domain-containing protein [Xanthobacteraceae bacterium]
MNVASGILGTLVLLGTTVFWPFTTVAIVAINAWRNRSLYFSFRGRLNPALFWVCTLTQAIYLFIVWAIISAATEDQKASALVYWSLVSVLVILPIGVSAAAAGVKRLHDHNRPGWWLLVLYGAPAVILASGYAFNSLPSWFHPASALVAAPLLFGAFVWLGCQRGTVGLNPYGPEVIIENKRKEKTAPVGIPPSSVPLAKAGVTPPEGTASGETAATIKSPAYIPAVEANPAHVPVSTRFFSFKGRLDRRLFWSCAVFQFLYGGIVASFILGATGYDGSTVSTPVFWVLMSILVFLPVAISAVAICVKRLHDLDMSGRWLLLILVPPLTVFVLLFGVIWLGRWRGTAGPNHYGPDATPDYKEAY